MNKTTIKNKVLAVLREKKVSQTDLMRKLHISRSSAFSFINNDSMTVERLMELSVAFNYNFLNEFSNMLQISEPPPRLPDGQAYPEKIHELEIEIKALRKVIAEMTNKA